MIGYITGILGHYSDNSCIIETAGGVGYEIYLPTRSLRKLVLASTNVALHTVTIVREDAITLFGFETHDEKHMFLLLTSISKVGAKTAVAILDTYSVQELYTIVTHGECDPLTKVSGIGKKTAQHILLELHYKIRATSKTMSSPLPLQTAEPSILSEAEEALKNLGYEPHEVYTIVRTITKESPTISIAMLLKEALRLLSS